MRLKLTNTFLTILLFTACTKGTVEVNNGMSGILEATMELEEVGEKVFLLDDSTAAKPVYTQIYKSPDGTVYLTFLNKFNNSIYFYGYDAPQFVTKIV